MKIWGQWKNDGKFLGFVVRRNGDYHFSHWKNPNEYHISSVNDPFYKRQSCKFYIEFMY